MIKMLNYSDRLENFKPFKMNKYLKLNLTLNHISTQVDDLRIWSTSSERYFIETPEDLNNTSGLQKV